MLNFILSILLVLLLRITIPSKSFHRKIFNDPNHKGSNWAVLIAGSNGYYNYRHQADIAHAYQILTKLGTFPPSNIITMIYDDAAWSESNPFPGQLFNEPNGDDVYNGIHIDYSGKDITANNFLSVLKGMPITDRPELPVLNTTKPTDNIFIYYSDHGASGLVSMPSGSPLYAVDLHETFHFMKDNQMYNELVFYLEACESGSMFDNLLEDTLSIFATTAANPTEHSYAYYYNSTLGTYMADEYSIRWMQDTEQNWENEDESLLTQFEDVASLVKKSSPQKYGDVSFADETIHDFEDFEFHGNGDELIYGQMMDDMVCKNGDYIPERFDPNWIPNELFMASRNVKLAVLQHKYLQSEDTEDQMYWKSMVEAELRERSKVDIIFENIMKCLFENGQRDIVNVYDMNIMEWDCYKMVYDEFEQKCGRFTDYSLKYAQYLSKLCQIADFHDIIDTFDELCAK